MMKMEMMRQGWLRKSTGARAERLADESQMIINKRVYINGVKGREAKTKGLGLGNDRKKNTKKKTSDF